MAQAADVAQTVEVPQKLLDQLRTIASQLSRQHMMNMTGVRSEAMASAQELAPLIDLQPILHAIVEESIPVKAKERICDEAFSREDNMASEAMANEMDPERLQATEKILEQEHKRQRRIERVQRELASSQEAAQD